MDWSKSQRIIFLICFNLFLLPLASAFSTVNLPQLSEKHHAELFSIASNKEALRFYRKTLQVDLQLPEKRTRSTRVSPRKQHTLDMQDDILALVAHMITSRLAISIRTTSQQENGEKTPRFIKDTIPGYQWAQTQTLAPSITRALSFNTHLSEYIASVPFLSKRPQNFNALARYVEQRYPELTGSSESWVDLLEQGNTSTISERLSEYWSQENLEGQIPESTSEPYDQTLIDAHAHYYIWTRLWPIFRTHLTALTIQAEAEAVQSARQSLNNLIAMKSGKVARNGTSRICGTWHWTVHNHQNHGDHKMTIVLGKTSQPPNPQPQPTEIKVNGDTVYLFWKFPRGYQEDSLLISNNDKRLEGTFVNSLGPYGSIMGKRISSCKHK